MRMRMRMRRNGSRGCKRMARCFRSFELLLAILGTYEIGGQEILYAQDVVFLEFPK